MIAKELKKHTKTIQINSISNNTTLTEPSIGVLIIDSMSVAVSI